MNNLTIGTDPEFALFDANRIVSAIPVLERGKDDKIDLGDGAAIYYDNTLAEANIAPASSREEFVNKLAGLYTKSKQLLGKHSLRAVASHNFSPEECEHPKAKEFGCDPELDVYDGGSKKFPQAGGKVFRSAGGHIHIGGIQGEMEDKMPLVVLMDIFVGIPGVLMDNDPTSVARKVLYGKAGRFRNTPYGIEYRTMSNFWLSTPELSATIYDLTIFAANLFLDGMAFGIFEKIDVDKVANAINVGDKQVAAEIFNQLDIPQDLKDRVLQLSQTEYNSDIFSNWKIC